MNGNPEMECPICQCPDCPNNNLCGRWKMDSIKFLPCPACGCLEREAENSPQTERGEQSNMISYTGKQQGSGSRPAGRRERSGIPFLSREHMTFDKRSTEVLAVRLGQDNRGNQQVGLKVNYGGVVYLWNLRTTNPNLEKLCSAFGEDETKWAGKKFDMALQQDEFDGTTWPTVFLKGSK